MQGDAGTRKHRRALSAPCVSTLDDSDGSAGDAKQARSGDGGAGGDVGDSAGYLLPLEIIEEIVARLRWRDLPRLRLVSKAVRRVVDYVARQRGRKLRPTELLRVVHWDDELIVGWYGQWPLYAWRPLLLLVLKLLRCEETTDNLRAIASEVAAVAPLTDKRQRARLRDTMLGNSIEHFTDRPVARYLLYDGVPPLPEFGAQVLEELTSAREDWVVGDCNGRVQEMVAEGRCVYYLALYFQEHLQSLQDQPDEQARYEQAMYAFLARIRARHTESAWVHDWPRHVYPYPVDGAGRLLVDIQKDDALWAHYV